MAENARLLEKLYGPTVLKPGVTPGPQPVSRSFWSSVRAVLPAGIAGILTWFFAEVLPSLLQPRPLPETLFKAATCLIPLAAALVMHYIYTKHFY
jgi:hypothetical protein